MPMTIGNDISTCGADDICLWQTISRLCRDDIRRRWRRTLETSTNAELKHGINAKVVGNLEEIAPFTADGLTELLIRGIAHQIVLTTAPPMAFTTDGKFAITDETDTKVDTVVKRRAFPEGILIADAYIGIHVIPGVFAADFTILRLEAVFRTTKVDYSGAIGGGAAAHPVLTEVETCGDVEVLLLAGKVVEEQAYVVAVDFHLRVHV